MKKLIALLLAAVLLLSQAASAVRHSAAANKRMMRMRFMFVPPRNQRSLLGRTERAFVPPTAC